MTGHQPSRQDQGASRVRVLNHRKGERYFHCVPFEDRFWSKVQKRGPDECWPWIGAATPAGYGILGTVEEGRRRSRYATRIAWSFANGAPWPDGKLACHTCDNPNCVNPAHIWPGTQSENLIDALRKGRSRNRYGPPKLSADEVRELRALYSAGTPIASLSRRFSLNWKTAASIARGETRKDV